MRDIAGVDDAKVRIRTHATPTVTEVPLEAAVQAEYIRFVQRVRRLLEQQMRAEMANELDRRLQRALDNVRRATQ